jgi:type I restriction enzyme S subunit
MMSEWQETNWGELATLEYGKSLKNYRTNSAPIPVYGTNGPIGFTNEALCKHPGVIIGRKGAYRGVHYSSVPFFVIDTAFYLKPINSNELDLKFCYYKLLIQDINRLDSGSAIPSTSRDDFYQMELELPPVDEQLRITKALECLDSKIANLQKQNQTLEKIAQTFFKQMIVP